LIKAIVGTLLLAAATLATAAELRGVVVGVTDGDTITILIDRRQVKVRLADIDAPESKQPFGARSKQSLSDLCFKKEARLETSGKDRYGRTIARVICAGMDANAEQVRRGMAWVFDRYASPNSPLYAVQNDARAARRGLWNDPSPFPPWEWRQKQRKK
jgi:endonuclease YncB( thermonuclease family)